MSPICPSRPISPLSALRRLCFALALAAFAAAAQAIELDAVDLDAICRMATEKKPEAKQAMCDYIRTFQREDGLFRRSEKDRTALGAENGRIAEAMMNVLRDLSHYDREYKTLNAACAPFAEGLEFAQKANGFWGVSLDDPNAKDDIEATARIAAYLAFVATGHPKSIKWPYAESGYLTEARKVQALLAKRPEFAKSETKRLLDLAMAEAGKAGRRESSFDERMTPRQRAAAGDVAKIGEFRVETTYECASVAWGAPRKFEKGVKFLYRKVGEKAWQEALEPQFYLPNRNYRGSIVNLAEGTEYEVKAVADGKDAASAKVKTWSSKVPVAKTVEVDPATAKFPITITDKGTPDGWIKYVPKDGKTLVNDQYAPTFVITGAKCVILDGFTIVGGKSDGTITITQGAQDIRILNCELSGWGPGGPPLWSSTGKGVCYEGATCTQNGAICLGRWPCNITIERCFIHSPRGRANSWRYSHPFGPEGIQADNPYSPVIRWCDIVGSDSRRYEDCIKSLRNGGLNTGLNYNADVQGCFLFGANDDCIELDGGQQNVRFFGNRCEEALMGVSVQLCNTSPSYVFENAFTGLGTEFGHVCTAVKTSSVDGYGYGAVSYFLHNTFCGEYSDIAALDLSVNAKTARLQAFNNLFVGGQTFVAPKGEYGGRFADNVVLPGTEAIVSAAHANVSPTAPKAVPALVNFSRVGADGKAVAGARPRQERGVMLPERPIPWALDAGRFDITVEKGKASRTSDTFKLACAGSGYRRPFRVRTTDLDHEWFDVTPKEGVIESGKTIAFTVKYDASKLGGRRRYAAAFLVRTDDGFSRPVSLHATTDRVPPFRNPKPKDVVVYGEKGSGNEWTFDVPCDGRYFIHVHGVNPTATGNDFTPKVNKIDFAFDGEKTGPRRYPGIAFPQLTSWPTWAPLNPGGGYNVVSFNLKAGKHVLRMDEKDPSLTVDGFALLQDPSDLEGEVRQP